MLMFRRPHGIVPTLIWRPNRWSRSQLCSLLTGVGLRAVLNEPRFPHLPGKWKACFLVIGSCDPATVYCDYIDWNRPALRCRHIISYERPEIMKCRKRVQDLEQTHACWKPRASRWSMLDCGMFTGVRKQDMASWRCRLQTLKPQETIPLGWLCVECMWMESEQVNPTVLEFLGMLCPYGPSRDPWSSMYVVMTWAQHRRTN